MNRSKRLLSVIESDFEYRQLGDLLNVIQKLSQGEYDLSNVEAILTASSADVDLDEVQKFITQYSKVCYIKLEGYSKTAKDLILLSDEPRKVKEPKTMKDTGALTHGTKLFAYDLE